MDDFERASEQEEFMRGVAQKNRKPVGITPNNNCHNCADDVPDGALFCSGECREDYERRERAKARNGK